MKRIFIYVKPDLEFKKLVKIAGDILSVPLLDYETDSYDEYPAYELDGNFLCFKILGVPPDLDNLKLMWDDLYSKKDATYQIIFLFFQSPPFHENGISISTSSYEDFGQWFIDELKKNGVYIEEELPPLFSEIED